METDVDTILRSPSKAVFTIFLMTMQLIFLPTLIGLNVYLMVTRPADRSRLALQWPMLIWFLPKTRRAIWACLLELCTSAKTLFNRDSHFAYTSEYFDDRSALTTVGEIRWSDVASIEPIRTMHSRGCIAVFLHRPGGVQSEMSGLSGFLMRLNNGICGTPIVLVTSGLQISRPALMEILALQTDLSRQSHNPHYAPIEAYLMPYIETPAVHEDIRRYD